nr:reverse transcriptase domain-containing protein [Tanacetum cinerariifolium]
MMDLVMHTEKNDTVSHTEKTRMLRLMVEIGVGGMTVDVIDKVTCSFDDLQLEQVDQKYSYHLRAVKISSRSHVVILPSNYLPEVRKELKIYKAKSDKSSIDEPPEVKLKDLPPHLEYAFLEGDDKLPVIIAKDLSIDEKTTPLGSTPPRIHIQSD